jgi:hypothetical protein
MRDLLIGVPVFAGLLLLSTVWRNTDTYAPPAPAIGAERTVAADPVAVERGMGKSVMFCTDLTSYSRLLRALYPSDAAAQWAEKPRCPDIPTGSRVRVTSLPWDIPTATGPTYRAVEVQVLSGDLAGRQGYMAVRDLGDH